MAGPEQPFQEAENLIADFHTISSHDYHGVTSCVVRWAAVFYAEAIMPHPQTLVKQSAKTTKMGKKQIHPDDASAKAKDLTINAPDVSAHC